jgi:hypothetical protein
LITTRCRVELTDSTGPACTACPSVGVTLVTRTGPGLNTSEPNGNTPVRASPRAACSATIALSVAAVKPSPRPPP